MRNLLAIVMALAAATIVGCSSPQAGSMSSDETFTMTAPTSATEIKQGDIQTVTVSLERAKFFKQDVTLVATATTGISVDPSKVVVKASDSPDAQFRIEVAKDAAIGESQVHVVATPEKGYPMSKDFTVKVVAP